MSTPDLGFPTLASTPDRLEAFLKRVLPPQVDAATAKEFVSLLDDVRVLAASVRQFQGTIKELAYDRRDNAETIHHLVAAMNAGHTLALAHPDDPLSAVVLAAYEACVADAKRSLLRQEPPDRRGPPYVAHERPVDVDAG